MREERERERGDGNREGERRTDGENVSMFPNTTSKPSHTLSSTGGQVRIRGRKVRKDGVCSATAASGLAPGCQLTQSGAWQPNSR